MHLTSQKSAQDDFEDQSGFKPYRCARMKRMDIGGGFVGEWSLRSGDEDLATERFLYVLSQHVNLKELRIKMIR